MSSAEKAVLGFSDHKSLVVVQWNPKSGTGRRRHEILRLVRVLGEFGFRVRLFHNRALMDRYLNNPAHRNRLCCIVGCGGDGTITDLLNRYPNERLAMLPMGTENLIARYFRLPRNGRSVAELVRDGFSRKLDTCFANEHRFLLMLSVGVDADVVRDLHQGRQGNISHLAYVFPILRAFLRFSVRREVCVEGIDGEGGSYAGTHVIVTNIPAYGFGFPFAPNAVPDDGVLDVRIFRGTSFWHTVRHAVSVWLGLKSAERDVIRFATRALSLKESRMGTESKMTPVGGEPLAVQADGDPAPGLPMKIRVEPRSLELIVPRPD